MSTKKKEEKYQPYMQDMVGQKVRVVRVGLTPWIGEVIAALDGETFLVVDRVGGRHKINIFDIRTPELIEREEPAQKVLDKTL